MTRMDGFAAGVLATALWPPGNRGTEANRPCGAIRNGPSIALPGFGR